MKTKIYLQLLILLLLTGFAGLTAFSQSTVLTRPCPGASLTTKEARVEIEKGGNVRFITCAGKKVLINDVELPDASQIVPKTDTAYLAQRQEKQIADYASLSAAQTAIGAINDTTLEIPSSISVSTSLTLTKNTRLKFTGTGGVNIASGQTLTVENGAINAPPDKQIFSGAGNVLFNKSVPETLYPEWFGAKGDGTTDDLAAFNKMIAAIPFNRFSGDTRAIKIWLAPGKTYKLSDTWNIDVPVLLTTTTRLAGKIKGAVNKTAIRLHSIDTLTGTDNGRSAEGSVVENITLIGNDNSTVLTTTHTVGVAGLTLTKTTGANFTSRDYVRGTVIAVNGFPYRVKSFDSATQLTLDKPIVNFNSAGAGATVLTKYYNPRVALPTGADWTGQTIAIGGANHTITATTATTLTISPGLAAQANYGEIQAVSISGAAALPMLYSGIELLTNAELNNNQISNFSGDGIRVVASAGSGYHANANNARLTRNYVTLSGGNGVLFQGQDANQISVSNNDFSYNAGAGIAEFSFLGNDHRGNHTSANFGGSRISFTEGAVNQSMWTGEYAESDQPPDFFSNNNLTVGGVFGGGIAANSRGAFLSASDGSLQFGRFRSVSAIDGNNDKATALFGARIGNQIFGFGAGEETANISNGYAATNPTIAAYQLRYSSGNYFFGYSPNGTTFNSVVGFTGSQSSLGAGKVIIPNALHFTGDGGGGSNSISRSADGVLVVGGLTNGFRVNNSGNSVQLFKITNDGNVGIGTSPTTSRTTTDGDVFITDSTKGIILKSPNGTCFRYTATNAGMLTGAAITCP